VVAVQVIAHVEVVTDTGGVGRVAPDGVEVQDPVEDTAGADPLVDLLSGLVPVGRVHVRAAVGRDGGGVHPHAVCAGAGDGLQVGGDDVLDRDVLPAEHGEKAGAFLG